MATLNRDSGGSPQIFSDAEAVARARRFSMVRYAISTNLCRREILFEALGTEAADCSGCDVCGGAPWITPPEEETILEVVRWNRGRFRKGKMARILIGRRSMEIRRTGRDSVRGFGALTGWELEDVEEALGMLIRIGKLSFGRFAGRKGRMVPEKAGNAPNRISDILNRQIKVMLPSVIS